MSNKIIDFQKLFNSILIIKFNSSDSVEHMFASGWTKSRWSPCTWNRKALQNRPKKIQQKCNWMDFQIRTSAGLVRERFWRPTKLCRKCLSKRPARKCLFSSDEWISVSFSFLKKMILCEISDHLFIKCSFYVNFI